MDRRLATVFGGSGFVGRQLVRRLAADGWTVRVAVRDPLNTRFLTVSGDAGQVVAHAADVTRPKTVEAAVDGAEWVINLVGILYEKGKRTFERIHVEGAETVAKACANAGVSRFVQVSAIGADPNSPAKYGRTKAAGEAAAKAAFPATVVVRPSIVFGPDDDFFNRFASMARFSPVLPAFPTRFQPVYVADVAAGIVAALADEATAGRTYEFGGPKIYTFREMMEIMLREIGREPWLVAFPFSLLTLQATFAEWLPVPPITRDQVKLLARDNVVAVDALTLADLGIAPTALEVILPTYLARFRPPVKRWRRAG